MTGSQRVTTTICQTISRQTTTPYICRNCRSNLLQTRKPNASQIRHASNPNLPFTEKLRRKIWGTDNPPGLKDPYGGPSFLEKRRMRNQEMNRETEAEEEEEQRPRSQLDLDSREQQQDQRDVTSEPKPVTETDPSTKAAKSIDQIDGFKHADTWDGLEHIGHMGDWRDIAPQEGDEYETWLYSTRRSVTTRLELHAGLQQAIIECYVYQQAGENLAELAMDFPTVDADTVVGSKIVVSPTGYVADVEKTGGPALKTPRPSPSTDFADDIPPDESFLSAKLDFSNPMTFPILKRFSLLTNVRIPDPILNTLSSSPLSTFITELAKHVEPKPKNLAEKLSQNDLLTSQGNVMVLKRRETPIDKEKEVGRWKVITRELEKRGIPALGKVVN